MACTYNFPTEGPETFPIIVFNTNSISLRRGFFLKNVKTFHKVINFIGKSEKNVKIVRFKKKETRLF